MTASPFRRFALFLSLSLAALGGCAGSGNDPAPEASDPTRVAAGEGCEDEAALAANGVTKEECMNAEVVEYNPNSGEANSCIPGSLVHKAVDPGPPRLVFICRCRQNGTLNCFLRN
jgi:hypothetical protein